MTEILYNIHHQEAFGIFIAVYFYLTGISAGSFILSTLAYLFGQDKFRRQISVNEDKIPFEGRRPDDGMPGSSSPVPVDGTAFELYAWVVEQLPSWDYPEFIACAQIIPP